MKRIVCFVLAIAVLFSVLVSPKTAYAATSVPQINSPANGTSISSQDGIIKIKAKTPSGTYDNLVAVLNVTTGVKLVYNESIGVATTFMLSTNGISKGDCIKVCWCAVSYSGTKWSDPIWFYYLGEKQQSFISVTNISDGDSFTLSDDESIAVKLSVSGSKPDNLLVSLRNLSTDTLVYNRVSMKSDTKKISFSSLPSGSYRCALATVKNGVENWTSLTFSIHRSGENKVGYKSLKKPINVPMYSQNDSQWAALKPGNSRYTIHSIGCLITSYAMCESYRTGNTITPSDIVKSSEDLDISESGGVIGGSVQQRYKPNEEPFSYSRIRELLMAGKPVIVRLTDGGSGEHFVVATQYKKIAVCNGNVVEELCTPANIIINDPGWGYTTLQEVIDKTYLTTVSSLRYYN